MNIGDYQPEPTCQIQGLAKIYESVFGLTDSGTFVEIGAYDGKTYSNTFQLARLGWNGIYVEPVPHLYEYCMHNHIDHPNVQVVQAFVSDHDNKVKSIYKWGVDTYTGDEDFIEHVTHRQARPFCECATIRLETLLIQCAVDLHFELLVIDVEGHELQVLQDFGKYPYRPKLLIVETHAKSKDAGLSMHAKQIHALVSQCNYRLIYADAINSIYKDGMYAKTKQEPCSDAG